MLSDTICPLKVLADFAIYSSSTKLGTPGANTNFFTTDVTAPKLTTRLSVTIATTNASTFSVLRTSGANTALKFNAGSNLAAGCVYTFVVGARQDETYNFQISDSGTVREFTLEAVHGGI